MFNLQTELFTQKEVNILTHVSLGIIWISILGLGTSYELIIRFLRIPKATSPDLTTSTQSTIPESIVLQQAELLTPMASATNSPSLTQSEYEVDGPKEEGTTPPSFAFDRNIHVDCPVSSDIDSPLDNNYENSPLLPSKSVSTLSQFESSTPSSSPEFFTVESTTNFFHHFDQKYLTPFLVKKEQ